MADYLINLSGNICELFIALYFFKGRYTPRCKQALFALLCTAFTLFQFLNTNLFLGKSPLVSLCSILFTFLISLLYDMKWLHRAITSFVIVLINILSECLIGMILTMVLSVDVAYTQNNPIMFAVCTLLSKFLAYIIVLVTKKRDFNLENYAKVKYFYLIYSLPVASLLIMLPFLRCCYVIDDLSFQVINLISSVVLVFANISVFYIIDKINEMTQAKEKLMFTEMHINHQRAHYQELYGYQNELKIFRHDIKNRLFSLMALIRSGQADTALGIMEKDLNWLDESNSNIVNSGAPVIDAIVQQKLRLAKSKDMDFNASIKLSEPLLIDQLEIGILLANTLENAIEATEKVKERERRVIDFAIISTKDRVSVTISNPTDLQVDTSNIRTTKKDMKNHGFGLQSVRQIVRKYDGAVELDCTDGVFYTNVNLANREG